YEAVFNLMESMVPEYDVAGIVRERTGSSLPGITPSNTYCSKDGSYVAIGGNSDAIFKRLMEAIGRPELGGDPRYATNADRTEHADELDALIEGWVEGRPTEEIIRILDAANVPVGPIYTVEDIVEDEQYEARGMLPEAEVEGVGPVKMPGLVPKLSTTPGAVEWYGGALGAHNEEVYGGLLGLSAEEIQTLYEDGTI
ncbi:MAG: CaiB/BaiF CoA transferase family protein, partial [Rubrobacter sp.]